MGQNAANLSFKIQWIKLFHNARIKKGFVPRFILNYLVYYTANNEWNSSEKFNAGKLINANISWHY